MRFSVTSLLSSARASHLDQDMLFTIRGFSPSDVVLPGPVELWDEGLALGQVCTNQPPQSSL